MPTYVFSEDQRQCMLHGTNSKWASDLSDADLQTVVWMVGEFGRRAPQVLSLLDRYWVDSPPQDLVAATRAKLALEGLFRAVSGERTSIAEFNARWGAVSERVWAAATSREPDLPAEDMEDRWPVFWNESLVGWIKDPHHEYWGCTGGWMPHTSPATDQFLIDLTNSTPPVQIATVGGVLSAVEEPPTETGQISVRWAV